MAKIRVSQHSGRTGSAKHNDRSFLADKSDQERKEMAPHIREDASGDNRFWCCQDGVSFGEAELNFYVKRYSAAQEATNERYRKEGHSDRCKTVQDLYQGKLTRPEETILQIGDMSVHISNEDFIVCLNEYVRQLNEWNREHGSHMHILNLAAHFDEASPHAHLRRVWDYTDTDGLPRLGQNKALEAAGIELPEPDKKIGRYNNRKITFDAMAREMWQRICKDHGFDIETEVRPNMKHKNKGDFIADQIDQQIEVKRQELSETTERLSEAQAAIEDIETQKAAAEGLEQRIEALQSEERILTAAQVDDAARDAKSTLFDKDKVVLPRAEYEALIRTAHAAEEAQKQAASLVAERKRYQKKGEKIIQDAQGKAREILNQAEDHSLSVAMERAKERSELDQYRKLEKRHPEQFREMRSADKHRRKEYER